MRATDFSAISIPDQHERIGMLSSMISETFSSDFRAERMPGEEFEAKIYSSSASGVTLSHALMSPFTLRNKGFERRSGRKYYASLTNQTHVIRLDDRRPLRVQPQELVIMRSDIPCESVLVRPYTTSCLVLDADLFEEHVPDHQALIARRLKFPVGLDQLLHATLDSCIAISKEGSFAEAGPRLARSFLELLALAHVDESDGDRPARSTALDIRRTQVKVFIERNYHVPDLTIGQIADQLQLTPRYVQLAFEADGITPSEYLRQCRINACASQLRDPQHRSRSITDIAFSNGFNSSSHFSTEFKRMKGASPRAWRALGAGD